MINYDENYYYNLLRIHTNTAGDIVKKRYDFIQKALTKDNFFWDKDVKTKTSSGNLLGKDGEIACLTFEYNAKQSISLLDYGCGVGFMKALKPEWVTEVNTYDIMPVPQTGIKKLHYDIITMYDVLEHIPDFQEVAPVLKTGSYVAISVPVKPKDLPWSQYKHFKPGEHLHYFTDDLIEHLFDYMGFELIQSGSPECPPRQYIKSYIFKNMKVL